MVSHGIKDVTLQAWPNTNKCHHFQVVLMEGTDSIGIRGGWLLHCGENCTLIENNTAQFEDHGQRTISHHKITITGRSNHQRFNILW